MPDRNYLLNTKVYVASLLLILMMNLALPVLSGPEEENKKVQSRGTWTCMAYIALDNNLDDYPVDGTNMLLRELMAIGSQPNMNLLAFVDGYRSRLDPGMAHVFYVQQGQLIPIPFATINSSWSRMSIDSGSPHTLLDYINFCADTFPADNYVLQMVNHGGGWKGHCWDYSEESNISTAEFTTVMERFSEKVEKRLDIVIFAECLMAQLEVLYPIDDYVDVVIGSEQITQPTAGFQTLGTGAFYANKDKTNEEIAVAIVEAMMTSYEITRVTIHLSAIDLDYMENLTEAVDDLVGACLFHREFNHFLEARNNTQEFGLWGESRYQYIDLKQFCMNLRSYPTKEDIKKRATKVIDTIKKAVLISKHFNGVIQSEVGVEAANGISIDFHLEGQGARYQGLEFAKATKWDEMIEATVRPDKREDILDELGYTEKENKEGETDGRFSPDLTQAILPLIILVAIALALLSYLYRRKKSHPSPT